MFRRAHRPLDGPPRPRARSRLPGSDWPPPPASMDSSWRSSAACSAASCLVLLAAKCLYRDELPLPGDAV